jgi:hypothetical protein
MLLHKIEPDDVVFLDTVLLLNGKFFHRFTTKETGIYLLKYNDSIFLSFIAQNGDNLLFSGDAADLNQTCDVQGNEETRLFLEAYRKLNQFKDKTKEWSEIYLRHKYEDDFIETCTRLENLYQQEFEVHKAYLVQFIAQHKGKLATLLVFHQKINGKAFFDAKKDSDLLQEIYNGLKQTYPNSTYTEDLKERLEEN